MEQRSTPQATERLLQLDSFLSLFVIQFLNVINDNIFKNAVIVYIVFYGLSLHKLDTAMTTNIAMFVFILPLFIFASYSGKFADYYSKTKLIRIIKTCEIGITAVCVVSILTTNIWLMMLGIFLLTTHSAFFGPIKYSILPHYFSDRNKLLLANSLIEVGSFIAILIGQFVGSWFVEKQPLTIVYALVGATAVGLVLSFLLKTIEPIGNKYKCSLNVFKDIYLLCKEIVEYKEVMGYLKLISWFWALGAIYTTHLSILTKDFMGGNAQVYSIIIAEFSIAIGLGSFLCTLLSKGDAKRIFILIGAFGMSILTLLLLSLNHTEYNANNHVGIAEFIQKPSNILNLIIILGIGISAGFYSITCYNKLQLISPIAIFSKIIAVNNIYNAFYMLIATLATMFILSHINVWMMFLIVSILNALYFTYVILAKKI